MNDRQAPPYQLPTITSDRYSILHVTEASLWTRPDLRGLGAGFPGGGCQSRLHMHEAAALTLVGLRSIAQSQELDDNNPMSI